MIGCTGRHRVVVIAWVLSFYLVIPSLFGGEGSNPSDGILFASLYLLFAAHSDYGVDTFVVSLLLFGFFLVAESSP